MKILFIFFGVALSAVVANVVPASSESTENSDVKVKEIDCSDIVESLVEGIKSWLENDGWKNWNLEDWWKLHIDVDEARRYAMRSQEGVRLRRGEAAEIPASVEKIDAGVQCLNKFAKRYWADDYSIEYRSSTVAEFFEFFEKMADAFNRFLRNSLDSYKQIVKSETPEEEEAIDYNEYDRLIN